jgi:hypothetical protein
VAEVQLHSAGCIPSGVVAPRSNIPDHCCPN